MKKKRVKTSTTLVDLWTTQQTSLEMVAMETGHGKYQQNPTSSTIHEVGSLAVSTVSFQALSGLLAWDVGFALRNLGICRDVQALSVIGRHWESTSVKPPWFDTSHLFIYSLRPSAPNRSGHCPVMPRAFEASLAFALAGLKGNHWIHCDKQKWYITATVTNTCNLHIGLRKPRHTKVRQPSGQHDKNHPKIKSAKLFWVAFFWGLLIMVFSGCFYPACFLSLTSKIWI